MPHFPFFGLFVKIKDKYMIKLNKLSGVSRNEFWWAFWGSILIIFWSMKNSFEFGRLAFVPSYDDVSYFEDAISRYLKFVNGNILLLVRDFLQNPPHAPLIAAQAVFSYMVFGIHDWSPYLTNGWIPFLVLIGVMKLTNEILLIRWPLFLYLLTLPMLGASIVEFRPDIAAGILTALSVALGVYGVIDEGGNEGEGNGGGEIEGSGGCFCVSICASVTNVSEDWDKSTTSMLFCCF
jgi:hypothetical protein